MTARLLFFFFAQAPFMRFNFIFRICGFFARFCAGVLLSSPCFAQSGIVADPPPGTVQPADQFFVSNIVADPPPGKAVPESQTDFLKSTIVPDPAPGTAVRAEQTDFLKGPNIDPQISVGSALVSVVVASDFDTDGDGRAGAAEDADGDATYGTLEAAWARVLAAGGGDITIVASGTYPVSLVVAAGSAQAARLTRRVTISAAKGVVAVLIGSGGSGVDLPGAVVVRGVTLRGYSTGVAVRGGGNLLLENCTIEDCSAFGLHVADGGTALIRDCSIVGTGEGAARPATSIGVCFERASLGQLRRTAIWESQGTGLVKRSKNVRLFQVDLQRNRRDVGR